MMVTRRNPIHCALWLIVAFFSLAVIYLTLNAQFIAVAQVMVYAGAIMMLIIFVIMLIHLETEFVRKRNAVGAEGHRRLHYGDPLSGGGGGRPLFRRQAGQGGRRAAALTGSVAEVGTALYGKYLFPFEIASILLLIGIVGAVVLARRGKD